MFLLEMEKPLQSLPGIGPAAEKSFASLGIFTHAQLVRYYPREWEDRTKKVPLADFATHPKVHTIVQVLAHSWFGFGRMKTLKMIVSDGSADAVLLCFNRPFLEKSYPISSFIRVTGSFYFKYGELQSSSFESERVESADERFLSCSVLPIYSLTAGVTQNLIRKTMKKALQDISRGLEDELPASLIRRYRLLPKAQALLYIHFPPSLTDLEEARRTLIYEELFYFQLMIALRSLEHRGRLPDLGVTLEFLGAALESPHPKDQVPCTKNPAPLSPKQTQLIERLPFSLTDDQRAVLNDINADIDTGEYKEYSMARILQGDVGSGKTLVAFLACLRITDMGGQSSLLAPTELLARQHAENAATMLEPLGVRLAFLTGNVKAQGRNQLLRRLKEGDIDILIGTHALFSANVIYHNLRFAVIDEQHRFGVLQREAILHKAGVNDRGLKVKPHFLMMSATPIPQTLAHTVFGDLDISIIRTLPVGRKKISTHLACEGNEQKVYDFVRKQLREGKQAYFVYPLIESVHEMYDHLSKNIYPEYSIALIHSQVDDEEQRRVMTDFKAGHIQVLLATTVVEVGVDVSNATCMVIHAAERFGLAALHQLRGRVGRGSEQSYCFLIYGKNLSDDGKARLKVLHETNDGFVIAEADLTLRGPGEISGIQQSGYIRLAIADLVRDADILLQARTDAFTLVANDPQFLSIDAQCIRRRLKHTDDHNS